MMNQFGKTPILGQGSAHEHRDGGDVCIAGHGAEVSHPAERKTTIKIRVLAAVLLLIAGCVSESDENRVIVLRGVTNSSPGSGHYAGLKIFKELVESRTDGAVHVELYSNGVLGDEEEMVEGMEMGTVHVMMAAAAKYANFVPELDLYSPPYTFDSWDHFRAVMDSDLDDRIGEAVHARTGDTYLGCFTDGVRNIFTRTPTKSLDDISGIKLRTMTGPNEKNSWTALGANPTPLAYTELYAALQTGVVDGAENTMTSLITMKFYESCQYVFRSRHNFLALPFVISERALDRLPDDLRIIVVQAGKDACRQQVDQAIELDLQNGQRLIDQCNVTMFDASAEDLQRARELCKPVQDSNAKRISMVAELEQIREIGRRIQDEQ